MNTEELRKHLIYFIDATFSNDEVKSLITENVSCGYGEYVKRHIEYLDSFIESNPDIEELGWFIATEMNRDFGDPTGEQGFQWLVSARDLMQSVLDEYMNQKT